MRSAVACILALLLAPTFASSTEAEPRDALGMSIFTSSEEGAFVTWTPAPGAIGYAVFRGESLETATYLGEVTGLVFHDEAPPVVDSWYMVLSLQAPTDDGIGIIVGAFRGSCLSQRGATGITFTASHCLPVRPL